MDAALESVRALTLVGRIVEFDNKLDIGHILTSLTILLSLGALLNALAKDRRSREREFGDRVRAAAAKTLGKLERWQHLSARLYQDVQPLFVEVSQRLHADLDAQAARDLLWRGLTTARAVAEQRIVDEEIQSAYIELYPYHPSVQRLFAEAMSSLRDIDESAYREFAARTQEVVLEYEGARKDYTPAQLGNDLRLESARTEALLVKRLEEAIGPIQEFLVAVVSLSDEKIVSSAHLPSISGGPSDG